jgi:hypothetical protein
MGVGVASLIARNEVGESSARPVWLGPPSNTVGATIPYDVTVGRSDKAAIVPLLSYRVSDGVDARREYPLPRC